MTIKYDLEFAKNVGEVVDRLVTVQVANSGGGSIGIDKPINYLIYNAARQAQNDSSLTYLAVKAILENVKENGVVVLSSGFFVPPFMVEEVDGTYGVAVLARAMVVGFGVTPVIVTEDSNVKRMEWLLKAVGLDPQPLEVALATPHKCAIEVLSRSEEEAKALGERLLALKPDLLLMAEKPSRNAKGVYHNGAGYDITNIEGKADILVEMFQKNGVVTIGVGDGGNEIGMGKIHHEVKQIIPKALECGCPCGGGIAATTDTDVLVVGTSANWGCYGIEAVLAAALGIESILHDHRIEKRIEMASVFGGLVDPSTGMAEGWTDGTDVSVSAAVLTLLQNIVKIKLRKKNDPNGVWGRARYYDRPTVDKLIEDWGKKLNQGIPSV